MMRNISGCNWHDFFLENFILVRGYFLNIVDVNFIKKNPLNFYFESLFESKDQFLFYNLNE